MEQAGISWNRLEQAGTGWNKLEQAEIGWNRLNYWNGLEQAEISWNRLEQTRIGRNWQEKAGISIFSPIPSYPVSSSLSSLLKSSPYPTNSRLFPNPQSLIPDLQFGMPNCAFNPQLDISVLVLYQRTKMINHQLEIKLPIVDFDLGIGVSRLGIGDFPNLENTNSKFKKTNQ